MNNSLCFELDSYARALKHTVLGEGNLSRRYFLPDGRSAPVLLYEWKCVNGATEDTHGYPVNSKAAYDVGNPRSPSIENGYANTQFGCFEFRTADISAPKRMIEALSIKSIATLSSWLVNSTLSLSLTHTQT